MSGLFVSFIYCTEGSWGFRGSRCFLASAQCVYLDIYCAEARLILVTRTLVPVSTVYLCGRSRYLGYFSLSFRLTSPMLLILLCRFS